MSLFQHKHPRRTAKFLLFLSRGCRPALAAWLAETDAPLHIPYRQLDETALRAAHSAAGWPEVQVRERRVFSRTLDLEFLGDDLVARDFRSLVDVAQAGVGLERDGDGLRATTGGVAARVTTSEEVNILHEIFVDGCYDLRLGGLWDVLDIGANIGIASLHFAAQPWVGRVWSFEPFPATADACEANLALNPGLAAKISLHRFGLGDREESLEVDYNPELKGSMTIHGLAEWRGAPAAGSQKARIQVRAASAVLRDFLDSGKGRKVLAKIDCEGAEYPILDDLVRENLLGRIDAIIMEWHGRRPESLVGQLADAGFSVNLRSFAPSRTLGLLMAWRQA